MTFTTNSLGSWTEATSDAPDELSGALALPGSWPWFPADTVLVRSDQVDNLGPPPPPAPTISAISPNVGPQGANTAVTITGTNFVPGTNVMFALWSGPNVSVVNATTIECLTSDSPPVGPADVIVTNAGGSGTLPNGFTYE